MVTLAVRTDGPCVEGPPQGQWTHTDWETLPNDGNRYEIIGGTLYMAVKPDGPYWWILNRLGKLIGTPVQQQKLGFCANSPAGIVLPGGNLVVPDFSVKLGSGKPKRTTGEVVDIQSVRPPDLIFEVVSPKTFPYMTEIKRLAYAAAGVPEYAIIDPTKRTLRLYALDALGRYHGPHEFGVGQSMSFACLPGITLEVGQLFEGAPDTTV